MMSNEAVGVLEHLVARLRATRDALDAFETMKAGHRGVHRLALDVDGVRVELGEERGTEGVLPLIRSAWCLLVEQHLRSDVDMLEQALRDAVAGGLDAADLEAWALSLLNPNPVPTTDEIAAAISPVLTNAAPPPAAIAPEEVRP